MKMKIASIIYLLLVSSLYCDIITGFSSINITKFRNVQIVSKNDVCRRC